MCWLIMFHDMFSQHADRMLKSRRKGREMEKRAAKLMDAENKKAAMQAASEVCLVTSARMLCACKS